jgi:hypothetical protein
VEKLGGDLVEVQEAHCMQYEKSYATHFLKTARKGERIGRATEWINMTKVCIRCMDGNTIVKPLTWYDQYIKI